MRYPRQGQGRCTHLCDGHYWGRHGGNCFAGFVLARQVALENAGPGWADILGAGTKCSASAAAFCNGVTAHALDFDDNCYAGFVHGSAIIVPAALAVAQERDLTGADLVTAIVVGAECEYAVGAAAGVDLYEKGWWTTGLIGPIGAGVAVGRLLGLDAEAMQSCIGFAVAGAGRYESLFRNGCESPDGRGGERSGREVGTSRFPRREWSGRCIFACGGVCQPLQQFDLQRRGSCPAGYRLAPCRAGHRHQEVPGMPVLPRRDRTLFPAL
nr:MmgE/PrpD family protein [Brucella anthropi]